MGNISRYEKRMTLQDLKVLASNGHVCIHGVKWQPGRTFKIKYDDKILICMVSSWWSSTDNGVSSSIKLIRYE